MSEQPYFRCPVCSARSYNPNDLREGYCGRCKDWTGTRIADVPSELLVRSSRMLTGMVVLDGGTAVCLTVYGPDPTVPIGYFLLPAEAGLVIGELLMDTSRKVLED